MSTSTLLTAKTEQEKALLWTRMDAVHYNGVLTYDASPAAIELWVGGVTGRRLQLPSDTTVAGWYTFLVQNLTDDTSFVQYGVFSVANDGATTAEDPSELDTLLNFAAGSGSNPLIIAGNTMEGTLAIAADDTNDALTINYTGAASKVYSASCTLFGMTAAGDNVVFTPGQVTTSA